MKTKTETHEGFVVLAGEVYLVDTEEGAEIARYWMAYLHVPAKAILSGDPTDESTWVTTNQILYART